MLIELRSEKFLKGPIFFHEGLNVVIGDSNGTNSIGKSTLLMVVDFAFGGESFLKHNTDVVAELGHHSYSFRFDFDGKPYYFRRDTSLPERVYICDSDYNDKDSISLAEFTGFLKEQYLPSKPGLSFRAFVSLFSRIWGKDNLNVAKPLHAAQAQSPADAIDLVLKIFNLYSQLEELTNLENQKDGELKVLNKAFAAKLLNKISKRDYLSNENKLENIALELQDIRGNLERYALNISEITNRAVMDLKASKDAILAQKMRVDEKLLRVRKNLANSSHLKSKNLASLLDFFPDVNKKRIADIEEFHSKVTKLLKKELSSEEEELSGQSLALQREIVELDSAIQAKLTKLDNPSMIVDRIYDLSERYQKHRTENEYYLKQSNLANEIRSLRAKLKEEKVTALQTIEDKINVRIREIVTYIYGEARQSPALDLKDKNYSYHIFEDTGTGKAYSNLVVFDLAMFSITELPILIHDSLLFKNIENRAVAEIIHKYSDIGKQSFIAIDEIKKYGVDAEREILDSKVIELSNTELLYIKDWRKHKPSQEV